MCVSLHAGIYPLSSTDNGIIKDHGSPIKVVVYKECEA